MSSLPVLVVVALASFSGGACKKREPGSARAARNKPAPLVVKSDAPPSDGALATVAELDCGSSIPEKQGETLRAMNGAGPGGSALGFQGGDLLCDVRFYVGCRTSGRLHVSVGARALPVEEFGHTVGGFMSARVRVPRAEWTAALERRDGFAYQTLTVGAHVEGECVAQDGGLGRAYEARHELTAGFADAP